MPLVQLLVALFQAFHALVQLAAAALDALVFIVKIPPPAPELGVRVRDPPPSAGLGIGDDLKFLGLGAIQDLFGIFRCLDKRALAFLLLPLQQLLHAAAAAEGIAGPNSNERDNEYCDSE